ncbi:hypothetical protein APHAL10511_003157 [Amanita phalloides]|nr:hypothetical protein APHAL10511_003157 [Amanita phalloides]
MDLRRASASFSLALLAEYTHTLDSLPLDLSRNFADLRELDAVLSSSMASITAKIYSLTEMIEHGVAPKEERLWLLTEIAEEAARLKLGGEDKIRVASQAADNLKSHSTHLRTLLDILPDFDPLTLARRTTYPHVAPRSFMPVNSFESGKKRKPNAGSMLNASTADPSPAKRKRVAKDDDPDVLSRSPRKDRATEGGRSRNNARRRAERAASPSESLVSVTSHIHQGPNSSVANARGSGAASRGAPTSTNSRQRVSGNTNGRNNKGGQTPNPGDAYHLQRDDMTPPASTNGASRRGGSAAGNGSTNSGARNQYGSTLLSSNSAAATVGGGAGYTGRQAVAGSSASVYAGGLGNKMSSHLDPMYGDTLVPDWTPPNPHQLEGPGMPPVQRANSSAVGIQQADAVVAKVTPGAPDMGEMMDGDEVEDERYCLCGGVSYGEMIACDDVNCEREWFHLACVGLKSIPEGHWYCATCNKKRNSHRPSRGGRRKNANARSAKAS